MIKKVCHSEDNLKFFLMFLYAVAVYCNEWIDFVNNTISMLQRSKEMAEDLKTKLQEEERLSFVTQRKKFRRGKESFD